MKTKTRKTTRILCASSIAAMTLLGSVAPALTTVAAEDGPTTEATTAATPTRLTTNGNQITFDKKILLDENENVPNATIKYTLTGRDAIGDENDPTSEKGALATAGYHNVEKGPVSLNGTDVVSVSSTKFTTNDDKDVAEDDKGQRSITKTSTIDARDLVKNTTKPTVYTYTLTEKAEEDFVTPKTDTRKLNIYVGYDGSNQLAVLYSTLAKTDGTKVTGFENNYLTSDNEDTTAFKVTKMVTGNQGDKTKYFNFTVTIKDQYSKVTATNSGKSNVEVGTPTADETGKVTVTVTTQLKDGDSLTLKGLTKGATYTVDEKEKGADGYTTTGFDERETKNKTEETIVTNYRNGSIPTGIYLNHKLPFNILGVALAGGAVALIAKKRHEDVLEDEDDE